MCANNLLYDVESIDDVKDMSTYYSNLLQNKLYILIYSGNNDLVCAYQGSRYWIDQLDYDVRGNQLNDWIPWHVNDEVGGWFQAWELFTFLVVRDAGHEVPEYQPQRAYVMFRRFLDRNWTDVMEELPIEDVINYTSQYTEDEFLINTVTSSTSSNTNIFLKGFAIGFATMIGFVIIIGLFVLFYIREQERKLSKNHMMLKTLSDADAQTEEQSEQVEVEI